MPSVFEEQERRPVWLEEMNRGRVAEEVSKLAAALVIWGLEGHGKWPLHLLLLLRSLFILSSYPPQDPPSLDTAIQHALAGLYPPFEATAPTILGQVFRLLDSDFQGDGLRFLLDFLIPAKRVCEQVREAACVSWKGRRGWGTSSPGSRGLEVSREGSGLVHILSQSKN